jgi:hypothetical protein
VLACDGYLSQTFDLALVPIAKNNRILGILVLDVEREMCPWAISKYFGDLVSNTSA